MPSLNEHSEQSSHNLEFLGSFFHTRFNDWAVTVMFYAAVHMVEAILDKNYSIDSKNHKERFNNLVKLAPFPKNAYKALARGAHDSRYKGYKVLNSEIHNLFKTHFKVLVNWFNGQVEKNKALNIKNCDNLNIEWYKKFQTDPSYNKCC